MRSIAARLARGSLFLPLLCWIGAGCAAGAGAGSPGGALASDAGDRAPETTGDAAVASGPNMPTIDAGAAPDANDAAPGSRCVVGPTPNDIDCAHETATIGGRTVLWETPLGDPPDGGWPVAVVYQGSLLSPAGATILAPHGMWKVQANDAANDGFFAGYVLQQLTTETTVIEALLDHGYAVITPSADDGGFAWDTNLPPWLFDWPPAPDNDFLNTLFAAIGDGHMGPLSASRWYATGVSSGGYMTSRMAISYPGRFRALAVAAGSYATCAGGFPTCPVPALPHDHPPTLFLHGAQDPLVPIGQMYAYYDALVALGYPTKAVVDPNLRHGWVPAAPGEIVAWFDAH